MSIWGCDAPSALPAWEGPGILLVDLDAFFASVEQLDHPGWRGKPVIVGGDADRRGVVATASYEARAYGVHSAMASSQARLLCPDAIWTHGHYARYQELSRIIMGICGDETPHLQQVSIDEAFLDVTPTAHNTEHPYRIAERIQRRVSEEVGVSCSVGIGTTKTIAKIASDQEKPHGLTCVLPGYEREFLSPLPIRVMSGIGAAAEKELRRFGIRTLGDLALADQALLTRVFGKNANLMRQRALGGESSAVTSEREVKSVSNETSFATDLTRREDVQAAIATMATKVGRRLRKSGLKGSTVTLKIRFGDRRIRTAQTSLPSGTDDEIAFTPLLYQLLDTLWSDGQPVRLVGVGVSHFDDGGEQMGLFDDPSTSEKNHELLSAADAIRDRFGEGALSFGHELRNRANNTGTTRK